MSHAVPCSMTSTISFFRELIDLPDSAHDSFRFQQLDVMSAIDNQLLTLGREGRQFAL
jgi:hypothetical protein